MRRFFDKTLAVRRFVAFLLLLTACTPTLAQLPGTFSTLLLAPQECTPSYSNTGGTGNRTALISSSSTLSIFNGSIANYVDGTTTGNNGFVPNSQVASQTLTWDFNTISNRVVINEVKFYFSTNGCVPGCPDAVIRASTDNVSWTTKSGAFTWGGTTPTITVSFSNAIGYRYWQVQTTSGDTTQNPWYQEVEFKICSL